MRLFIMRHCERDPSPLYKSQLTIKGQTNAYKLATQLHKNGIKKILFNPYQGQY